MCQQPYESLPPPNPLEHQRIFLLAIPFAYPNTVPSSFRNQRDRWSITSTTWNAKEVWSPLSVILFLVSHFFVVSFFFYFTETGTISIGKGSLQESERYLLFRVDSLFANFYNIFKDMLGMGTSGECMEFTSNLLYSLSRHIGNYHPHIFSCIKKLTFLFLFRPIPCSPFQKQGGGRSTYQLGSWIWILFVLWLGFCRYCARE